MRILTSNIILTFTISIGLAIFSTSCSKNNDEYQIPNVGVEEVLYLNNPSNFDLQVAGGYLSIPAGYRGIIVYRRYATGGVNDFAAYEQACPLHFDQDCGKLEVEDGIYLMCPCDSSQWVLFDGSPIQGNNAPAVKFYNVQFDGINRIRITN
ncbi:MAG: hypothetical protein SchgKO_10220 [Schleiferiaceae bacterium]